MGVLGGPLAFDYKPALLDQVGQQAFKRPGFWDAYAVGNLLSGTARIFFDKRQDLSLPCPSFGDIAVQGDRMGRIRHIEADRCRDLNPTLAGLQLQDGPLPTAPPDDVDGVPDRPRIFEVPVPCLGDVMDYQYGPAGGPKSQKALQVREDVAIRVQFDVQEPCLEGVQD
jgi:hypothetical protein